MLRALLAAACLAAAPIPAPAQDASELFAQGERTFATGDYAEALRFFVAARAAGSAGPGTVYNIGVCQYRLGDYESAANTFAELAATAPALRELAEYNRGLALLGLGDDVAARTAFERARSSADEKIAALASAQLGGLDGARVSSERRLSAYFSAGLGHDDNVALVDELLLPSGQSGSSPVVEALGIVSREFDATALRFDASGYVVRYADASEFDQSVLRLALVTDRPIGAWRIAAGPTFGRTTLDGDGFEELMGADVRVRRGFGDGLAFDARLLYDRVDAGEPLFDYLEGDRRQLRLAVQHTGAGRVRVGYDLERNARADRGVSSSRRRWSVIYQRRLAAAWSGDAAIYHRTSRYSEATVPREERLLELSLAVRRDLGNGWTLGADYRWSDNDSTYDLYSYDRQRVSASLSRSFPGD